MMIKIGKLPSEKQFGWNAFYLNSGHDVASAASRGATAEQAKSTLSKVKAIVKSNFKHAQVAFNYKAKKGGGYSPARLHGVQHAYPNDSGVLTILTFLSFIQRVGFIEKPDVTENILRGRVCTFINEQQREYLSTQLAVELNLLPTPKTETKRTSGWLPHNKPHSATPTRVTQTGQVFNTQRRDI